MLITLSKKLSLLPAAILLLLASWSFPARAQYFQLNGNTKRVTFPFRFVRNMIIIPVEINNKGPFNFILDTGVGMMVITEPSMVDSIDLSSKRLINIHGRGEGEDNQAYLTSVLKVDVNGITGRISAALLQKDYFNLSDYAGMPIHGLLGYEFFADLAVKISFGDSTITVFRPKNRHAFRKGNKVPITIEDHKPYMQAGITFPDSQQCKCKMIIDIGAGHPLSVEKMKNHALPQKYIPANLGVGLNGPIAGYLSRVNEIDIGRYKMKDVITSFPNDTISVSATPRDGNIGIGLLKKFDMIFDYPDSLLYLKPGIHYTEPFEHDMSGLEYYGTGEGYHHVIISRVEPGSAGDEIGLEKGDEIISINFKTVDKLSLEEIDGIFKSRDNRSILLTIFHDKRYDRVILTLKRRI